IDGDVTRVLVYAGEAHISASGAAVTVGDGRLGQIDAQGQLDPPLLRQLQLLTNPDFSLHDQDWSPFDVPNSRLDVNGQRFWVPGPETETPQPTALQVVRQSVKAEHGETGLIQKLDVNVSGYRHLWLRAMVRVDYAD